MQTPQRRGFDAILRDATSLDEIERRHAEAEELRQPPSQIPVARAGPVGEALSPVLYFEKTDLMFWMLLVQTLLLFFIWRKL